MPKITNLHEARRKKITTTLLKAARDLIELDAVPFGQFQAEVSTGRGVYVLVLKAQPK